MDLKVTRNKENKYAELRVSWLEPAFLNKVFIVGFYDSDNKFIGEYRHRLRAQDQGQCLFTVPRLDKMTWYVYLDLGPDEPVQIRTFVLEAIS